MTSLVQRSMAAGEVSPRMGARSDVSKYQSGMRTMRNFQVTREGSAMNRGGLEFICPRIGFGSTAVRLIGFVFNNAQSYMLVFQDLKLFFIRDGFPILETAVGIAAVTQANPPVVNTGGPAHGYTTGDLIYVTGATGMTEINGRFFTVTVIDATHYSLGEEAGVNGTAYGAYGAGASSSRIYSLVSPYTAAQLPGIRFIQSGDVMTLSHNLQPVYNLSRIADASWTLAAVTFAPSISGPVNGSLTGTAGATTVRYKVTSVKVDTLEESYAGLGPAHAVTQVDLLGTSSPYRVTCPAHGFITGDRISIVGSPLAVLTGNFYIITKTGANTFTLNGTNDGGIVGSSLGGNAYNTAISNAALIFPSVANPATITWTEVTGALQYNIYREINGIFGFVGSAVSASFIDQGYSVDPLSTPPVEFTPFAGVGNYPRAVGYYQQRLIGGGSDLAPESNRVSRSSLFYNFTQSNPIQDDDGFAFTVASNQVNAVQHYVEMDRLWIFTQGAEFTIEGNDAGTLTPFAIAARKRSENGISDVRPLVIGQAIVYVQVGSRLPNVFDQGNVVYEISSGQTFGAFNSRDLTVFSSHLFESYSVADWSYSAKPNNIVWAVRSDGTLLGMTYILSQDVLGWHRHDTGAGDLFKNVACIPEGKESATYAVVNRANVNGQTRAYVERIASRVVSVIDDAKIADSFRTFDSLTVQNATPAFTYTLHYDDDAAYPDAWYLVPAGGAPAFTLGDSTLGNVIALHLTDGTRILCRLQLIVSVGQALVAVSGSNGQWVDGRTGAPNDGLDADGVADGTVAFPKTLPYTTSAWSLGASVITGMWHLNGRSVYALADGNPEGPYTVTNGAVTLAQQASKAHIGLQIIADLVTLPPDDPQGQTLFDKRKTVAKISALIAETDQIKIGIDSNHLNPWNVKNFYGETTGGRLRAGVVVVPCQARTDYGGTVMIRQDLPVPATILALIPTLVAGS